MVTNNYQIFFLPFYTLFFNKNPCTVQIICDEYKTLISGYLLKSNKYNMIDEVISIDNSHFSNLQINDQNIDALFDKIKGIIKQFYSVDIGNLHILPMSLISDTSKIYIAHSKDFKNKNNEILFGKYLDLIIKYISEKRVILFPHSLALDFLSNLRALFANFSYENIFVLPFVEPR